MNSLDGHLHLRAVAGTDGVTALVEQRFRVPFHLSKPNWDPEARVLHAQVVNPTAGILEGDRLESTVRVDDGAALLLTTPSASRVFRMDLGGHAVSRQSFDVRTGGWLEVFPEPLVPHRGSVFFQETALTVEPGAGLLYVDQLNPGRLAYGEAWSWKRLVLGLTVRFGGALVHRERFDQSGDSLRAMSEFAGTGEGACFANVVLIPSVYEASPAWHGEVAKLHRDGVWVGVSPLRAGGWTVRLVAPDSVRRRDALGELRAILRNSYPRLGCGLRRP
jgi:urease accessory protein